MEPGEPQAADHGGAFCAIGIMAKAPRAGSSKTRLIPPLTAGEAAELSAAFIRDIAANIAAAARSEDVAGYAAYTPRGSAAALREILPAGFGLVPPRSAHFGDHLHDAAADLLALGHRAVCLVNSDSPTLPTGILVDAARRLRGPGERVVLGPAADGGYYLIGLTRVHRRLFEAVDWGTERVFRQTVERAAELGLPVEHLPVWYDVDDVTTLRVLARELFGQAPATGHAGGFAAPHTRGCLTSFYAADPTRWDELGQRPPGAA
jgi:rSAM/selenodomain-associated transferase 1